MKQVILGAYTFGVSSTLISFIILGNYGLGLQMTGRFDSFAFYKARSAKEYLRRGDLDDQREKNSLNL